MNFGIHEGLTVQAVVLSHEFIDRFMPAANGEYVKVFLYLLRCKNAGVDVSVADVADALNHTEADVKRAIAYWKQAGVLTEEEPVRQAGAFMGDTSARPTGELEEAAAFSGGLALQPEDGFSGLPTEERESDQERLLRLSEDEEFTALLYAVQQYLKKSFSPMECEKFAYLYDELHMSAGLLEYLAEYCAGGGHTSIRYIERVALNWHQLGITTREAAREYTLRFSKDISSVMKAFGLTGRGPAAAELEYMKKWFREYGFDYKLVSEACGRTIKATGAPSFPYADKILTGWKENGVKVLGDVEELDKKRQEKKTLGGGTESQRSAQGRQGNQGPGRGKTSAPNRFKNFEERENNYEAMIYQNIRNRQRKEAADHGTQ